MKTNFFLSILRVSLVLVFLSAASLAVYAQGAPPPDPQAVPLDPLSWVLLASGGVIGAKKYYNSRRSA